MVPNDDEPVRFEQDIKPLFRPHDQQSMKSNFDLWAYADIPGALDAILHPPTRRDDALRWCLAGRSGRALPAMGRYRKGRLNQPPARMAVRPPSAATITPP